MSSSDDAYRRLLDLSGEVRLLEGIAELLSWDRDTFMPPGGSELRARQTALLAGLIHGKFTTPEVGDLIDRVEGSGVAADPASLEAANLRLWRREYDRATRVPTRLVETLSQTAVQAQTVWIEAREKADFAMFRPWLEKLVSLRREEAAHLARGETPYDALLDAYEPGMTVRELRPLLTALGEGLVGLVNAIADSGRQPKTDLLNREFPVERQKIFGEATAAAIGYDFARGRLDVTTHPFCVGIGPGDVRITTRYKSYDFVESLFGILHEAGHGLYEQNVNPDLFGMPVGRILSMGMHESQSRFWENFIGRSRAFWTHFYPRAQQIYHHALRDVTFEDFFLAVNAVEPSYIRVDSDEVTYNLHILLRFEIEQALIHGEMDPADVPEAWAQGFSRYLGLEVPDHRLGCLQDVHWACGLFGYFPTYTLGNLYAAQFHATARRDIPDLDAHVARGDFRPILEWLGTNVYDHGSRYLSREFVHRVSGQPVSHRPMLDYLEAKYQALYGLDLPRRAHGAVGAVS